MKNKFENGDTLKDKVTGFTGVVLGYTLYSTGCIHYGLVGKSKKNEKLQDWEWFDQSRLELTKTKRIEFEIPKGTISGAFPNAPKN